MIDASCSTGATSGATRCQISSVMKGISGCRARRSASSTPVSVARVAAFSAVAVSPCRIGFDSSKYQSQYSFHVNSYSAFATRSIR